MNAQKQSQSIQPSPNQSTSPKPTVGSLFAGIGGFDLGFEWAGFHTCWLSMMGFAKDWMRPTLRKLGLRETPLSPQVAQFIASHLMTAFKP